MRLIRGFLLVFLALHVRAGDSEHSYQITLDLPQPGENGVRHNDYLCRSASLLNTNGYIVRYEPRADPRIAHHMLLYGCSRPAHTNVNSWSCKSGSEICQWGGTHEIIYAWALNASGIHLPEGVGLQVGPSRNMNYVVLQIHYGHPEEVPNLQAVNQEALTLHLTTNRQQYISGIFLLGSMLSIAPHQEASHVDSACEFRGPKIIHPFAFRTHAHSLGKQIAGYIVKGGSKWELIGTRSPQDPQAFYPSEGSLEVDVGDWLAVRCVFNTLAKAQATHIGPDSEDEMCNFYIMYYTENDGHHLSHDSCWSPAPSSLHYPVLPSLPPPTHIHHHESDHKGGVKEQDDDYVCASPVPPGPPSRACKPVTTPTSLSGSSSPPPTTPPPSSPPPSTPPPSSPPPSSPPPSTPPPSTPPPSTRPPSSPPPSSLPPTSPPPSTPPPNSPPPSSPPPSTPPPTSPPPSTPPPTSPPPTTAVIQETPGKFFEGEASPPSPDGSQTAVELVPAEDWPLNGVSIPGIALGQVSAVAMDHEGFVHILHRGPVVWDGNSFSPANVYRHKADGPIVIPTIVKLTSTGQPKRGWGTSTFYMPHGLTVDPHGHFWVTDVAMHQVFKFDQEGDDSPSMTLGTAFAPGTGRQHFCKPAAVAVESSGIFYIADGYCNHRIIKYSAAGNVLEIWDQTVNDQHLYVPHSLALSSYSPRKLFVADRENHRIVSYDTTSGNAEVFSDSTVLGNRVFAISFNGSSRGPLYGVFGPRFLAKEGDPGPMGFTVNEGGQLARTWGPEQGFSKPHDLAVDPVHNAVYVAEIGPNRIWKFVPVKTSPLDVLDSIISSDTATPATARIATSSTRVTSPPTEHSRTTVPTSSTSSLTKGDTTPTVHESSPPTATMIAVTTESTTSTQSVIQDVFDPHLPGMLPNSTNNTTGDKASESSNTQHTDPVIPDTKAAYSYGIFAGIVVVLLLIVLVVVGILKEHKNLRYSLRYGCRKRPKQRRQNPRKTLDSLLGPSQLGFSRLRTYDSDSEVDEFPIFSRV